MGGNSSKEKETKPKVQELSEETVNLLTQSTSLNKPTILNWHKQFIADCPNGKLNKTQFEVTYNQLYQNGDATKFSGYVFEAFDKDKSGFIDFPEFLTALFFLSDNGNLSDRLTFIFKVYDIDGNGRIDRKELEKIIVALYDLRGVSPQERTGINTPSSRAEEIMTKLDRDNSKNITRDEFVDGCLNDLRIRAILLPTQL